MLDDPTRDIGRQDGHYDSRLVGILSIAALFFDAVSAYFYAVALYLIPEPYPLGDFGPLFELSGSLFLAMLLNIVLVVVVWRNKSIRLSGISRSCLLIFSICLAYFGLLCLLEMADEWGDRGLADWSYLIAYAFMAMWAAFFWWVASRVLGVFLRR
jgi:hypothetical protein